MRARKRKARSSSQSQGGEGEEAGPGASASSDSVNVSISAGALPLSSNPSSTTTSSSSSYSSSSSSSSSVSSSSTVNAAVNTSSTESILPKAKKGKSAKSASSSSAADHSDLSKVGSANLKYKFVNKVDEDHKRPLYSVQFNFADIRHKDMFATIGSNRATIYKLHPDGLVEPVQAYADAEPREELYTCAWSLDAVSGAPILLVAGAHGIIKAINCFTREVTAVLQGHGGSVGELRTHPLDSNLILSCSKDESIRLWNLKTKVLVAVFAGDCGHRDEVLSADFHLSGDRMASCGMDHTVKIWNMGLVKDTIAASYDEKRPPSQPFKTQFVQFPDFSTNKKLHNNYVDCVRWYGDFLLSKSVGHKIIMWKLRVDKKKKTAIPLQEFRFADCAIWYVRFCLDFQQKILACGNKTGSMFVWNVDSDNPNPPRRLSHVRSTATIRQVAFNYDASSLIGVAECGSIWRWDAVREA